MILAAGLSSRMKSLGDLPKAVLELGGRSMLRRTAEALRGGGVESIVVVTGHKAGLVEKEAESLGLASTRNSDYRSGMFSSALAGLEALFQDGGLGENGAFFMLPVDAALLWQGSVAAMVRFWQGLEARQRGTSCIVPTYAGRCGHPPLFGAALGRELSGYTGGGGVRGYLASLLPQSLSSALQLGFAPPGAPLENSAQDAFIPHKVHKARRDCYFLPLPDRGLLSDLDQPSELTEAALFLDITRQRQAFAPQEAWEWLRHRALGTEKTRHCIMVGLAALRLGLALRRNGHQADPELGLCAGLLHDIGRGHQAHTELVRRWIEEWGRQECALAAGAHTVLPAPLLAGLGIDLRDEPEAKDRAGFDDSDYQEAGPGLALACACVYLADKYFQGDALVSIARRFAGVRERFAGDEAALRVIARREEIAAAVADRLGEYMSATPESVIAAESGHSMEAFCQRMLNSVSA